MGVKIVSFHFGIPHQHQIQALKQAGVVIMVTATNLVEAQLIEQAGIDVIIAQGIEAGGHRGARSYPARTHEGRRRSEAR